MATYIGRRCKLVNCLPFYLFPALSSHFLTFLVLSCSLLSFLVLWWMGGSEDKGTHGRKDIRTDGRTDGTQLYKKKNRRKKGRTYTRTNRHVIILFKKMHNPTLSQKVHVDVENGQHRYIYIHIMYVCKKRFN